jgi:DnaK suppressor protein
MNEEKPEYFRRKLLEKRESLTEMVQRIEQHGRESDTGTQDIADMAVASYTREFMFSKSSTDHKVLQMIRQALQRIEDRSYGTCVNCEEEIQFKRLDAVPWTSERPWAERDASGSFGILPILSTPFSASVACPESRFCCRADVAKGEIALAIEPVQQRQHQRRRDQQKRSDRQQDRRKELQPVEQPVRHEPEIAPGGYYRNVCEPGRFEKVSNAVPRVSEIVVRRLVNLPVLRNDNQEPRVLPGDSAQFPQHGRRLADVLERDDIQAGVETVIPERERQKIADDVKPAIIPARISHADVEPAVAVAPKEAGISAFAGSRIQNAGAVRHRSGEIPDRAFDRRFELQQIIPHELRHNLLKPTVSHIPLNGSVRRPVPHAAGYSLP